MKVTNGYYRELMEANGSLEAVGFREHDRQEEELLERRYERCKREYDKEKPNWMNCTNRRSRQGGKPCNA